MKTSFSLGSKIYAFILLLTTALAISAYLLISSTLKNIEGDKLSSLSNQLSDRLIESTGFNAIVKRNKCHNTFCLS
ncbi:MAG: hypothetical protein HOE90_04490 [Bacteriovoracaceae bacterium]|jgi:hypothetical protein|nr:hypothetical protein [Bacteriovoracaceae bacterium]